MMLRKMMAGALFFALTAIFAANIFAATSNNIYKSAFSPSTIIVGNVRIECPVEVKPLMVWIEGQSGKRIAIPFKIVNNNIAFDAKQASGNISRIIVAYQTSGPAASITQAKVYAGAASAYGSWQMPEILTSGALTAVTDTLSFGQVGAIDTHSVAFTTTTVPISDSGVIYVVFPQGFNISGITAATYRDNDPSNDGQEPTITSIGIDGNTVSFQLDSLGVEATAGSRIGVKFWTVANDTTSGSYNVIVMTTKPNGEIENGPAPSAAFNLNPGPLTSVVLTPSIDMTLRADSIVQFSSTGYDSYNNSIAGLNFTYSVTADSCGQISFGTFRALKLGSCRIISSSGGHADTSGLITVVPGPLAHFTITGYPSDVVAGHRFPGNVTITALDNENNKKYDYLGALWFSTGDTIDQVPCLITSPCSFTSADSGRLVIDTTGFILRKSGVRNITATNGTVGVTSGQIRVTPATINSFALIVTSPQVAGVAFNAVVSNAKDIFGNDASGEIVVSDSVGGGNSPGGYAPTHNDIIVTAGTGQANQIAVNAVSTRLKGVLLAGSVRAASAAFLVNPGALGSFTVTGFPTSTIAGDTLPPPITARAFDSFGNLKTNYTGQVTFTSSDLSALLPPPTNFLLADNGVHNFNQVISLRTAGAQTITVADGSISVTSPIINVIPDNSITSFTLTAPGSVTSGVTFTVTASNCRDAWNNLASGIIVISDSVGGGNAPDGTPPSYNSIIVTAGSGSALQTVTNAISTRLKGVVSGGTARTATGLFTVAPGSLDHFDLPPGYPTSVVAGDSFSTPLQVRVYDTFSNIKTNYTGLVYFTSSDLAAVLPYTSSSRYQFLLSDAGVHNFGRSFILKHSGAQTITVTDGAKADTSQAISVSPAAINSFAFGAIDTVTAGTPFTVSVSNCQDLYGNLANGTIVMTDSTGGGNSPDGYSPTHVNITVVNGAGNALQTATNATPTRLKGVVSGGTFRTATQLFQVVPGALSRFNLSGYPTSSIIAGTTFPDSVRVTAYDNLGNQKINYRGNVYFTSTDGTAVLPFTSLPGYQFTVADAGYHAFTGFILKRSGSQTITVTDGTLNRASQPISVIPATINSFAFTQIDTMIAGVPFAISVNNCQDIYGNLANGTIVISDSIGGGNSPDGYTPTRNNISVSSGAGTASETMVNAIATRLKGVVQGGTTRIGTSLFQVVPGTLGRYNLSGYPTTSIVAGTTFPDSVRVTAYDNLGNLKTNYGGNVYFTSTDGTAVLPFTQLPGYHFTTTDRGYHAFTGFILKRSGGQTITVTDGTVSRTSQVITVNPNTITSFSLSMPDTVTAGVSFNINALNCQDIYGNLGNGVIVISDSIGGGNSPDGQTPTRNNIAIANGTGSAVEAMVNAIPTRLKGVVQGGTARVGTQLFQVVPGTLGSFTLSGSPDSTLAGASFTDSIRVTAFDNLGNLKINYTGNVYFTSTDPNPDLPNRQANPFPFISTYRGYHAFVGSGFRLRQIGRQTISITDGVVTQTSQIINVTSNTMVSFSLTAISDTAIAGAPFTINVTNGHDSYNNPASGIIIISDSIGGGSSPGGVPPSHNNITVSNGTGSANQILTNAVATRLKGIVQGGTFRTATQLFQVAPGSLERFGLDGYPDSTIAGNTFADSIRVNVFDNLGNLKTNYVGNVYFTSTDSIANLPYLQGTPFSFNLTHHGYHAFVGSGFSLRRTGLKTISITNGTITEASRTIRVNSNIITSFSLTAPGSVASGIPFNVAADSCHDIWNNRANGIIVISDSIGGHNAPDGAAPIHTDIIVSNGTGNASQTMMKTEPVMLKGHVSGGSTIAVTDTFVVTPGILNHFTMAGLPTTTTAGDTFPVAPQMVTVSAFDIHSNLKNDYVGIIHFASSDPNPILPSQYHFVSQDSGSHDFGVFSLRTAPRQTITVFDGSINQTSPNITVLPNIISSFILSAPDTVRSGLPFNLVAGNCHDIWNNPGNGTIVISDSIGGNPAPDGLTPILNDIVVSNGSGTASVTMMNAEQVMLKGVISGGSARGNTGLFIVMPGALDHFRMSGFPDTIVAGVSFPDAPQFIAVRPYDSHNNSKTDYNGDIYFTSSDGGAILPYTNSSPFNCQPQPNGEYDFTGPFTLLHVRAGGQIISVTDGSIIENSPFIAVTPATIDDFRLSAQLVTLSGEPFHVNVYSCTDFWGNPANGSVVIADSIGGGMAPDGTRPIYNTIPVNNGTGSALQTLFNADTTLLKGTVGSVVRVVDNNIDVLPGTTTNIDFRISSPQTVGISFRDTAMVTVYDQYSNLKYNFDPSADSVVITCSDGANMLNNVLNHQGDFNQGVADLTTLGTTYLGSGGPRIFRATSRSGIVGSSNTVVMNALQCENLTVDQAQVSPGDTATGSIVVNNQGGNSVVITSLAILDSTGTVTQPISTPTLPDTLAAGVRRSYSVLIPITHGWSIGLHRLTAAVQGSYSDFSVIDTLNGFPESVDVLSASLPAFVGGTLRPDTLSTENIYSLSFSLQNIGHSGLALNDTSYFQFSDGTHQYKANLISAVYLPPDSSLIPLAFDSTAIDTNFAPGTYQGVLHYFGTENGFFLFGTMNITDNIVVQRRAALSYIPGSLNLNTLVPGQNVAFSIRLTNLGNADFMVQQQNTRISFSDGQREYVAYPDTTPGRRVDVISQDTTTFYFTPTLISSEFITGQYSPAVVISGTQNGHNEIVQFSPLGDQVSVISPATIGIDSTYSMSLNTPFVNTSQPCSLIVIMENFGDEGVDSTYVHLSSTGHSHLPDSMLVSQLSGHESRSLLFQITAATTSESLEVIMSRASGGKGHVSGNAATIRQPRDNTALLIVETPAQLAISPVTVIGPPEALDDTISVGQAVTISTMVQNSGQAGILGNLRLLLDLGNTEFTVDSIYRDYTLGVPVSWTITAPSQPLDSADIAVRFVNIPWDANDSTPVASFENYSTIRFVVNTSPTINQRAAISSPAGAMDDTLSTGQTFIVTDTLHIGGLYQGLTAGLYLPPGFATDDSLLRYPTGNTISWHVRGPDVASVETLTVASWLFDINTGDSIGAIIDQIPITVVGAAELELTARIAGPPPALDGIVEPGGQIQLEADIVNRGTAGASFGRLTLRTGRIDVYPVNGDSIRDFNLGNPILWDISLPDSEIAHPVAISVVMTRVPIDENTNNPVIVNIDSSSISLLIRELLPRLIINNIAGHSGSAVKGHDLAYLDFDIQNADFGGNFTAGLFGFSFDINSNPSMLSSEIISGASLVSDLGTIVADNITGNKIGFSTTDTVLVSPNESRHFNLVLTIKPGTPVRDFTLSFGGNWVSAVALEDGLPVNSLTPVSPRGEAISWQGDPTAVLEQSFAGSVSSYPNPFNPKVADTKIGYYLAASSNIEIKIFTLLGELVWTKNITASDPLGAAGLHTGESALGWSGKNDAGMEIRSGVYICVIRNITTGEEERFKIAIVK